MAYSVPVADFLTTALSGAIAADATTATIGTGLDIPATNGILQLDYDSSTAVGSDNGPETISYGTYNSGTGAIAGLTRGLANTDNGTPGTGVAHGNGASVMCGPSSLYFQQSPQYDTWNSAGTLTYASADSPTFTATISGDSTSAIYPGVRVKLAQDQALSNYWTFNTNSADSVGGATMADIGTPTYSAGKFSNALTLNGSTQALSITDAAGLKPTGDFTIGCWFKTSNTGANKNIFQSYSDNTNAQGIKIRVESTNVISFRAGSGSADDTTAILGTTTVTDGNFHYVVVSARNNWVQVYLDGKLEASGYMVTPTYNATNYVRIGCGNVTGANEHWFNGQIDDLFLINGYALDEQTIAAKYALGTAQGTSAITLTKYFLCTASSYSAPNTTVTLYGGTDHSLANATISSAYYSTQKAPLGFPLRTAKWQYAINDASQVSVTGISDNNWKQPGTVTMNVPIGSWNLSYYTATASTGSAGNYSGMYVTLSRSSSSETDSWMTSVASSGSTSVTEHDGNLMANMNVHLNAKTTYYLIAKRATANITGLFFNGYKVIATSTLL